MKLSKNFYLHEFTRSAKAKKFGIDNTPNDTQTLCLINLCENILQPIRDEYGPVRISSGFRSRRLNSAIGGSRRSQHMLGKAADIECKGLSNEDLALYIARHLDFDQVILEFYDPGDPWSGWVHVSYNNKWTNRGQVLTAIKEDGRTIYKPGIIVGKAPF